MKQSKFYLFILAFSILVAIIPFVRADLAPLPGQYLFSPYGLLAVILIVIDVFLFKTYTKNTKEKSIKKTIYLVLAIILLITIVCLLLFLLTYNPPRPRIPYQSCIGLETSIIGSNLNDSTITVRRDGTNTETKNVIARVLVNGIYNTTTDISDKLFESKTVLIPGLKSGDEIKAAPIVNNRTICGESIPHTIP